MADLSCAVVPTEEYGESPENIADFIESIWGMDIEQSGDYEMDATATNIRGYVELDSPDDFDDAWAQIEDSSVIQSNLNVYDAVIVIDDRSHLDGPLGRARVGGAGTSTGYGYVKDDITDTSLHELGHIFGVSHDGSSTSDVHWTNNTDFHYCVMGDGDLPTCDGETPHSNRGHRFSDCAIEKIRDTADDIL